jgi:2-oxo-4-hydroxy-4-carboxy-5-ureidoimidazoline decarboxylase
VGVQSALSWLNDAPAGEAERALLACCASAAWARAVAGARPYHDPLHFQAAVEAANAALTWPDIEQAVAAHPRLGERAAGWSAGEQAGVSASDAAARDALAAGNRAYEEKFGHIYLACATGRGAADLLAFLRARLANDPITERSVVREELAKITWLRIGKLLNEAGTP